MYILQNTYPYTLTKYNFMITLLESKVSYIQLRIQFFPFLCHTLHIQNTIQVTTNYTSKRIYNHFSKYFQNILIHSPSDLCPLNQSSRRNRIGLLYRRRGLYSISTGNWACNVIKKLLCSARLMSQIKPINPIQTSKPTSK